MSVSEPSRAIVSQAARRAALVGVAGAVVPPVDIVGITTVWIKLIMDLGRASGQKVNRVYACKVAISILMGSGLYIAACRLFTVLLDLTGAGLAVTIPICSALDWFYTLRFGNYLAEQFSQPGFSTKSLGSTTSSIASLVFVLPTGNEFLEAYQAISDALPVDSDAAQIARKLASAADRAHQLGIHNNLLEAFRTTAHGAADVARGLSEAARLAEPGADGTLAALDLLAMPAEDAGAAAVEAAGVAALGGPDGDGLLARLGQVRAGLDQVTDSDALLLEAVELAHKYGPADAGGGAGALPDLSARDEESAPGGLPEQPA